MHASHLETISEQFLRVTVSLFLGGQTYACIKNSYLVKFNSIMITMHAQGRISEGNSRNEENRSINPCSTIVLP